MSRSSARLIIGGDHRSGGKWAFCVRQLYRRLAAVPDAHSNSYSNCHCHCHIYPDSDSYRYSYFDSYSHSNSYIYAYSYRNGNEHTNGWAVQLFHRHYHREHDCAWGNNTGNHCDDCATTISLPFPVSVYGQSFNSAAVSSNGAFEPNRHWRSIHLWLFTLA